MKNQPYIGFQAFILLLCLAYTSPILAQPKLSWESDLGATVQWQEVTALGNLIVSTSKGLSGLDPVSGEVQWTRTEFANLNSGAYSPLQNAPFVLITQGGTLSLLDPFYGNVVFNSNEAGFAGIKEYYFLYRVNGILITGEKAPGKPLMAFVDLGTGKVGWNLEENFGKIVATKELSESELLVVTLFENYKINSKNGSIIWKNANSPDAAKMQNMGGLGALAKLLAEGVAGDMEFIVQFYQDPGKDVFYVANEKENKQTIGETTTVTYTNVFNAFNLKDGSLIWPKPLEMKGKLGQFAFYKNGLIVLPDDGNRTKINMFNSVSGEGLWGKKGNGIPIKGGVYDYVNTGKGFLLVTRNDDKNYLNFLDPELGLTTFDKAVKIDGTVVGTILTPKGILYITTEEINILNQLTGDLLFDKSVSTRPELTVEADGKIYAFDTRDKVVKVIDQKAGTVKNVTSSALKFEGKEEPTGIELRETGIFLNSDQNAALFDYSGRNIYEQYFPAPREPGIKRALLYAQAIRAAYIGANAYYSTAVLKAAAPQVAKDDAVAGAVVQGFGEMYNDLGNAASNYAVEAFQRASARFKATSEGRDFMIVLNREDSGNNTLVKLDKDSGKTLSSLDLGKEREPSYAVDDVSGQVYLKVGNSLIRSYDFNAE